ncbi:MAG: ExbD/TolR family protein [Limisphaerales bacterium]
MRFLIHKRRNTPTIIIVALVDVLIVLLIFLMVTTTFKQQPSLRLTLPQSSQAQKSGVGENQQFEVYIASNGVLLDLQDKMPVSLDVLKSRLLQEVAKNPQLKIAINADKNAPFYRIVNVMDIVKELKIKSVSASVDTKPAKP